MSDELLQVIVTELAKSPAFARALADEVAKDKNLLLEIVKKLDPNILGNTIAEKVIYYMATNRQFDAISVPSYKQLIVGAELIAKEKLADYFYENMQKEVQQS